MATAFLRKLYNSLVPVDQESADLLEKFKPNAELKCDITRPRNIGFHRKYFALLDLAFDAWEMPVNEYKGVQIEKNRDRFRKDLMIMAGYGYPVVNIKGDVRFEARSMSFGSMDQTEFEALYSRMVDVILQKIMTHYTRDDLDRVVAEVLRFC